MKYLLPFILTVLAFSATITHLQAENLSCIVGGYITDVTITPSFCPNKPQGEAVVKATFIPVVSKKNVAWQISTCSPAASGPCYSSQVKCFGTINTIAGQPFSLSCPLTVMDNPMWYISVRLLVDYPNIFVENYPVVTLNRTLQLNQSQKVFLPLIR